MTEPAIHAVFVIEKTYPHPLARVYAAFADPELKSRWFNPGHRQPDASDEHDFRIGGVERTSWLMDENTPFPGAPMTRVSLYLDIVPEARIVTGSNMAMSGRVFSSSLLTFEFAAAGEGARLTVTHQGAFFEHADGPVMREDGWRKVLERLGESL